MSDDLIQIYESDDFPQAEMIHQRLVDNGIDAFVKPTASPLDGLTSINQGTPIMVRSDDAEKARRVVEAYLAEQAEQ